MLHVDMRSNSTKVQYQATERFSVPYVASGHTLHVYMLTKFICNSLQKSIFIVQLARRTKEILCGTKAFEGTCRYVLILIFVNCLTWIICVVN